jgi:hypothetical protein
MSVKPLLLSFALTVLVGCGVSAEPAEVAGIDDAPEIDTGPEEPSAALDGLRYLADAPASCSRDAWCWRAPSPTGNDYAKVYSTAKDNVWMIGAHGVVMQWNGERWRAHEPAQPPGHAGNGYAYAITGLGPKDMWLIIGATVQHWDGATWTVKDELQPCGPLTFGSIWEASNGDVWVTLNNGSVSRARGGGVFERIDTGCRCFLGAIYGTAPDDFWISTLPSGLLHSDGQTFTRAYYGDAPIGSFVGKHADDLWVSGADGALLHWDGQSWQPMATGLTSGFLGAAGALDDDDVWWWWTGNSSATAAFVHWNGTQLTTTPVDTSGIGVFLDSAAIIGGQWWLVGGAGAVFTRSGERTVTPVIDPQVMALRSMWGSSRDTMYFATGGELLRARGGEVVVMEPGLAISAISGVRTERGDELFGIGTELGSDRLSYEARAFHFDGTRWTKATLQQAPVDQQRGLTQVRALAPGEAIAVGRGGAAYYFVDGAWKPIATGVTADLFGVWSADGQRAWITGSDGTLLRWERSEPSIAVVDPSLASTRSLGMIDGAQDVLWIVADGQLLRGDAAGWREIATPFPADSLLAVGGDEVVIASAAQSLMARWDGSSFAMEDNGSAAPTPVLFQLPDGPLLAGGLKSLVEQAR